MRDPKDHRYQAAKSFTSTLRTAGKPENTCWYVHLADCPAALTHTSAVQMMPKPCWICNAMRSGTQKHVLTIPANVLSLAKHTKYAQAATWWAMRCIVKHLDGYVYSVFELTDPLQHLNSSIHAVKLHI